MITDLIVICALLVFLAQGAAQGVLASLIGPLAFFIATFAAFCHYNIHKDLVMAFLIAFLGQIVLCCLFPFLLNRLRAMLGDLSKPSFLSRIFGAAINVVWGMAFVLPIIFMLVLIAPTIPAMKPMNDDLKISNVSVFLGPIVKTFAPASTTNAASVSRANSTAPDASIITAVAEDPRMKTFLADPQVIKWVENKNYAALMSDPRLLEMAKDPEFLKKLLAAYAQVQENNKHQN